MTEPALLTLEEAAEALRCSVKTVRRRIDAGFPAVKVGREWRVPRVAIERLIARALAGSGSDAAAPPAFTMAPGGRR